MNWTSILKKGKKTMVANVSQSVYKGSKVYKGKLCGLKGQSYLEIYIERRDM